MLLRHLALSGLGTFADARPVSSSLRAGNYKVVFITDSLSGESTLAHTTALTQMPACRALACRAVCSDSRTRARRRGHSPRASAPNRSWSMACTSASA
jgi:hypothetical protein